MAEQGALTGAVQQLKGKENNVKGHLAMLQKFEKELALVECTMTEELQESLRDIQKKFMLLRESFNQKEASCCLKIREAAETRMNTIKRWREKSSEACARASDVSLYFVHVDLLVYRTRGNSEYRVIGNACNRWPTAATVNSVFFFLFVNYCPKCCYISLVS